jgi:hypothetical protein
MAVEQYGTQRLKIVILGCFRHQHEIPDRYGVAKCKYWKFSTFIGPEATQATKYQGSKDFSSIEPKLGQCF